MLEIKIIETKDDLEKALNIRRTVFVHEHNVPEDIELDEFDTLDSGCVHVLALYDNKLNTSTCRINAFVVATAISLPASINILYVHSLSIVEDSTLTIAKVSIPSEVPE